MIITIIGYVILSFLILYFCSKISYNFNLVDKPNKRKIHTKNTAYTGGIAISIILLFAILLFDNFNPTISLIITISFLISIVGTIDDKYNLNIGGKLSLQIIPIFYMIIFENLFLIQLGDYKFFSLDLGTFSIPFTLLAVLFLINAFNYFDGIDGLLSLTSTSVLVILFFLTSKNNSHYLVIEQDIYFFLIVLAIPILIFLIFNFSFLKIPKLFLGDGGSLLLGFIISFLLIYFAKENFIHPMLLAWSVVIYVYEFLSINLIRMKNKQMVFKPGLDHLHYLMIKNKNSVFFTNLFIVSLNLLLFSIGYSSFIFINETASLILFIIFL